MFAGYPGSAHDNRVLQVSDLMSKMVNNPFSLFPFSSYHIVGDSAFEDASAPVYLISAYKDTYANTMRKRNFNKRLSKTRIVIEHAFGLLKCKWRRLFYINAKVEIAVRSISGASCVWHQWQVVFFITLSSATRIPVKNSVVTAAKQGTGVPLISLMDLVALKNEQKLIEFCPI